MTMQGMRASLRHPRLLLGLWLFQLMITFLYTTVVARTLVRLYGEIPLFDRAVATSDIPLFQLLLAPQARLLSMLVSVGVALALVYWLLSIYLVAGVILVLSGGKFADAGARIPAFLRLALWSAPLFGISLAILAFGLGLVSESARNALSLRELWMLPFAMAPGVILAVATGCAVNFARIALVCDPSLTARKALVQACRRVLATRLPLVHYAGYLLAWLGVTAVYVLLTYTSRFAGITGALLLLALRQALCALRLFLHVSTYGGQVFLVSSTEPPSYP